MSEGLYGYKAEAQYYGSVSYTFTCTSSGYIQDNEYDYLKVDNYRIYKTPYGQPAQLLQSCSLIPDSTVIYCPSDPLVSYEIRLYGSNCEYSDEHYLYKSYQGNGGGGQLIDPYEFTEVKAHF